MMKKLFSVLVILCWLNSPAQSQVGPQRPPNAGVLETMKIGFLTNRLNLTEAEAEKFWPIYRQYAAEVRQAYVVYHNDHNELGMERSLLNIKEKYSVEFLKAISPGKINDFFRAEKDFNVYVQQEIRRRQMQNRAPFRP